MLFCWANIVTACTVTEYYYYLVSDSIFRPSSSASSVLPGPALPNGTGFIIAFMYPLLLGIVACAWLVGPMPMSQPATHVKPQRESSSHHSPKSPEQYRQTEYGLTSGRAISRLRFASSPCRGRRLGWPQVMSFSAPSHYQLGLVFHGQSLYLAGLAVCPLICFLQATSLSASYSPLASPSLQQLLSMAL